VQVFCLQNGSVHEAVRVYEEATMFVLRLVAFLPAALAFSLLNPLPQPRSALGPLGKIVHIPSLTSAAFPEEFRSLVPAFRTRFSEWRPAWPQRTGNHHPQHSKIKGNYG
jgi:hypothetical protein